MKVIIPSKITLNKSTYPNNKIPGDSTVYATFSSSTAYAIGAIVVYGGKYAYKKLTGTGASSVTPDLDTTNWAKYSITEKFAPFDLSMSTKSTDFNGTELILLANDFDALVFIGATFSGIALNIEFVAVPLVGSGYTSLNSMQVDLNSGNTFVDLSSLVAVAFPSPAYPGLRITRSPGGGNMGCFKEIVIGKLQDLGATRKGWDVSINDYSKKLVDEYGNVSITKRGFSSRMNISSHFENDASAEAAISMLETNRATPMMWIGVDSRPSTWIIGYGQNWSMKNTDTEQNILQLTIEGVV
jgi:hypothetical protein